MGPWEAALAALRDVGFPVAAWAKGRQRCALIRWRWCDANGWYITEQEYRACRIFGVALPPVPRWSPGTLIPSSPQT